MNELYAHTPNESGQWHYLDEHLKGVAELAKKFAGKFEAGNLAYWIAVWHDLGKYSADFQNRLTKLLMDKTLHEIHCAI